MKTELFDFPRPEDRIALRPVEPRDTARLLCVQPGSVRPEIPGQRVKGDEVVVIKETKKK